MTKHNGPEYVSNLIARYEAAPRGSRQRAAPERELVALRDAMRAALAAPVGSRGLVKL